ncbi:MAG: sigma-54-dependent Fis family transcriptional regulator [Gemmatimonadales bacterium]|nr:sigma-54-dependent Fis family transcriptional regulator [Gemmatimonadales bacterium]
MRILILDPAESFRLSARPALEEAGYEVRLRRDADAALVEAQAGAVEALLLDLDAGESGVLNFLRRYRAGGGAGIVLVSGGSATAPLAGIALREGADAFVRAPIEADDLLLVLRQAEERERLRQEVARLRATLGARGLEPLVVAEDPKMRGLLELAARAAAADGAVLITGEKGTGKALLAQAMHRFSRRGDGAFVAVDCDAAPDLFSPNSAGREPLSPTPLPSDPQSLWRSANRGTLLLEEVVALSPDSQKHLLTRLGGRNGGAEPGVESDVRVMATSCLPVDGAVGEGRFQAELLQRLRGAVLTLPALRDRPEDIPALVTHFAQQVASRTGRPVGITPQALAGLQAYAWPGNVRELRQIVERAATLSPSGKLDRSDFPVLAMDHPGLVAAAGGYALKPQVEAVEKEAILRALAATQGTRREAARLLHVSLRTLFYKLRRYGLA